MKLTPTLQWIIRITGLIELILGIVFCTGNAHALTGVQFGEILPFF